MPAKVKRFIVLALGDLDKSGFNEETLPVLIALMESAKPDFLQATQFGVTGYFIASARSSARVEKAILESEKLRETDDRFSKLGIGVNDGDLLADFHWWGALKRSTIPPLGNAVNDAVRCSYHPTQYRENLKTLRPETARQSL